ncbi:unnamed protein product [Symbiodinium sp. CCMP2456]|nr:unnamed protein product [Symbiodinium sp. CCMP2456]
MLCRMCNKFGDHARKEHEGHSLMSTVEAFQQAMQASTEADAEHGKHSFALQEVMQERHFQLMEVHSNFEETQGQMDVVLRGALDQLERAQSRKLEFLQSMKRQVTTQLLFIQWLDNFQAHARMALPPADFVVATKRHEGLLAALFGSDGNPLKGAELGIGPVPLWVDEELLLEGAVSVQLTSLPPPIAEPGPMPPNATVPALEEVPPVPQLANVGAAIGRSIDTLEGSGSSYLEATPRRRSNNPPPAGIGGISDTLYVKAESGEGRTAGDVDKLTSERQVEAGVLDASAVTAVDQIPGGQSRAEFDGYISQAFAYLEEAQKNSRAALPAVAVAVPPRVPSLQLATEVLVQLRQSAEASGGPAKPWGVLLALLSSCPGGERQELLLRALRVAAPIGDTAGQLARAVVEDDVQRTQVPSLLVSANGLHTALVQALMRLSGSSFMEKETSMLVKEVEAMKPSPTSSGTSSSMHVAVESFLKSMIHSLRVGQALVHPSLASVCHLIYAAAEVKFGILAAQNAVGTLLVSRVITPSLLRVQRPVDAGGASERVSELSRLLQRIAHFAHHDDEARGQTLPDLNQELQKQTIAASRHLPADPDMAAAFRGNCTKPGADLLSLDCWRPERSACDWGPPRTCKAATATRSRSTTNCAVGGASQCLGCNAAQYSSISSRGFCLLTAGGLLWCPLRMEVRTGEAWKAPEKKALVRWGQSLEVLAVQLKLLAAALLRLLQHPDQHAAVQATLRSSLHHCASVSRHEVLPGIRLFMIWSREHGLNELRQAVGRERGLNFGSSPASAKQEEVDLLSSDRQRALVRSLQVASSLGVPDAAQLASQIAAHFCSCERLHHQAKLSVAVQTAPGRCGGSSPQLPQSFNGFNFKSHGEPAALHCQRQQPALRAFEHRGKKAPWQSHARPQSCPRRSSNARSSV